MNKKLIVLTAVGLIIWAGSIYFLKKANFQTQPATPPSPLPSAEAPATLPPAPVVFKDGSKLYTLNQIQSSDYSFYAGDLNNPNRDLGEDIKNAIIKTLETAHFPAKLVANTVFVSLSPNSEPAKIFLKAGGNEITVDLNNAEISTRNGAYIKVSSASRVILLNSNVLPGGEQFTLLLLHELGHRLADEFSPSDWQIFYGLRLIPKPQPLLNDVWDLSPNEDFAEVYKYITVKNSFGIDDEASAVRTRYGFLMPKDPNREKTCGTLVVQGQTSLRLQECRRYVSINQDSFPDDTEYFDANEAKLKDFITGKINSL